MKLNVTVGGCEVTVEELDGKCVVTASQNGEIVEEFSVDTDTEEVEVEVEDTDVDVDTEDVEDTDVELEDQEEDDEFIEESVKNFSDFLKKN